MPFVQLLTTGCSRTTTVAKSNASSYHISIKFLSLVVLSPTELLQEVGWGSLHEVATHMTIAALLPKFVVENACCSWGESTAGSETIP